MHLLKRHMPHGPLYQDRKPVHSQTIPFTNLPTEIRNRIYYYALVESKCINSYEAAVPNSLFYELIDRDGPANKAEMMRVLAQPPLTCTSNSFDQRKCQSSTAPISSNAR